MIYTEIITRKYRFNQNIFNVIIEFEFSIKCICLISINFNDEYKFRILKSLKGL